MITGRYIGLMSGNSLDAVDAALCEFSQTQPPRIIATHSSPISDQLAAAIMNLEAPESDQIHKMGHIDTELGILFATCVIDLLKKTACSPESIVAIGSHGQTIRHVPNALHPFTIQIGDPNIIAAMTKITTIADFRRRDLAEGGQAAPLAPSFHQYAFSSKNETRLIFNIGGICNITVLPNHHNHPVTGFDIGPGNTLIDLWAKAHIGSRYDHNGAWAQSGAINKTLLASMLSDPYFQIPPPKSTGKEYFNRKWLQQHTIAALAPEDVQATLTELTAKSIAAAASDYDKSAQIFVCGGGSANDYLMQRIQANTTLPVLTTDALGISPRWVEPACFAYLAARTFAQKSGNLPSVTGAKTSCVLGAIYPGKAH